MGKSNFLDLAIACYFLVQLVLLLLLFRTRMRRLNRLLMIALTITLVPVLLALSGMRAEFADGGGLNNVLIFLALTGGVVLALVVFLGRWLMFGSDRK